MEVGCSLEDMARVLAEGGYNITDDPCFDNAAYLPSVLASLDSPDSFPESPCSDEDIARVLDIVPMPSPSLLVDESCSHVVPSVVSHTLPDHSPSSDHFGVNKTRDPCIANAGLPLPLPQPLIRSHNVLPTSSGAQSPDIFSIALNCPFPDDSSNFNTLSTSKDNDIFSHSFYFNSSSALSPVSETDTILPGPLDNLNKCSHNVLSHHSLDIRVQNHLQHQTSVESTSSENSIAAINNVIDHSDQKSATCQVDKKPQTKRKRRRKNGQGTSKPKRRKQDTSKSSAKSTLKESADECVKNTQVKTKAHSSCKSKTTESKATASRQQTKKQKKTKADNNVAKTSGDLASKEGCEINSADKQTVVGQDQTESPGGIGSTNGVPVPEEAATGLRRSSRATRNTENYNFRLSSLVKRDETERKQIEPKKPKGKAKPPPLSKYRRRTANARERDRMKEINDAFDTLKAALPEMEPEDGKNKITKFTILKLALNYISSLQDMLIDNPPLEENSSTVDSNFLDTPGTSHAKHSPSDNSGDLCIHSANTSTNNHTQNEQIQTAVSIAESYTL